MGTYGILHNQFICSKSVKKDNSPPMNVRLFSVRRLFSVTNLMLLVGPLLSGVSTFFVLSDLMVPARITIASSLSVSLVVFGICMHYQYTRTMGIRIVHVNEESPKRIKLDLNLSFIFMYLCFLVVCTSSTYEGSAQLIPWEEFNAIDVTRVADGHFSLSLCQAMLL